MSGTLAELMRSCSDPLAHYDKDKYLHVVPSAPVVNRAQFILELCRGQRVLSLGGSGPLEDVLRKVCAEVQSVDIDSSTPTIHIDLDREPERLRDFSGSIDIVLCGEIIEHLSNPGRMLDAIRELRIPVIVTAPNAHTDVGAAWLERGTENVNREHVAYYSYKTLNTLLKRHGFEVRQFAWYNGRPRFAEGVVFYAE